MGTPKAARSQEEEEPKRRGHRRGRVGARKPAKDTEVEATALVLDEDWALWQLVGTWLDEAGNEYVMSEGSWNCEKRSEKGGSKSYKLRWDDYYKVVRWSESYWCDLPACSPGVLEWHRTTDVNKTKVQFRWTYQYQEPEKPVEEEPEGGQGSQSTRIWKAVKKPEPVEPGVFSKQMLLRCRALVDKEVPPEIKSLTAVHDDERPVFPVEEEEPPTDRRGRRQRKDSEGPDEAPAGAAGPAENVLDTVLDHLLGGPAANIAEADPFTSILLGAMAPEDLAPDASIDTEEPVMPPNISPKQATSMTLHRLPPGCTRNEVMAALDKAGLTNNYNFIHVPLSRAKTHLGIAFINFRRPADVQKFIKAFHQVEIGKLFPGNEENEEKCLVSYCQEGVHGQYVFAHSFCMPNCVDELYQSPERQPLFWDSKGKVITFPPVRLLNLGSPGPFPGWGGYVPQMPFFPAPWQWGWAYPSAAYPAKLPKAAKAKAKNVGAIGAAPKKEKAEEGAEETTGEAAKEQPAELLMKQVEYWFSVQNICRDTHLRSLMDGQGWVALSELAKFPRAVELGLNTAEMATALLPSKEVEVNEEELKVRIKKPDLRTAFGYLPPRPTFTIQEGAPATSQPCGQANGSAEHKGETAASS